MLLNLSVTDFIGRVASDAPAPGGRNVAALLGALSAALLCMICRLSEKKIKEESVREEIRSLFARADALRNTLSSLVDEDTAAFNQVVAAMKIPKQTPEKRSRRTKAVEEALKKAAETPLTAAQSCAELLELARKTINLTPVELISDIGVGAGSAAASLEGAVMNVKINLLSIKDNQYVTEKRSLIEGMVSRAAEIKKEIDLKINDGL